MLMNLTRMRAFSWTSYVVPIYKEYKLKITWGDQDIINIIFHFHPGNYLFTDMIIGYVFLRQEPQLLSFLHYVSDKSQAGKYVLKCCSLWV